jgi:hypothetical protein
MEWISHDSKWNTMLMKHRENIPESRVQDGVTACNIKIWQTIHALAHISASINYRQATLPRHLHQSRMPLTKNITMLTTLVANIGYVPLKSKVFHLQ